MRYLHEAWDASSKWGGRRFGITTKPSFCRRERYEGGSRDVVVSLAFVVVVVVSDEDESLVGTVGEDEFCSLVRSGGWMMTGSLSIMVVLLQRQICSTSMVVSGRR